LEEEVPNIKLWKELKTSPIKSNCYNHE
jgi:hypothetical protein